MTSTPLDKDTLELTCRTIVFSTRQKNQPFAKGTSLVRVADGISQKVNLRFLRIWTAHMHRQG